MTNRANNPWIEKKHQLLEGVTVVRTEQAVNPETDLFTRATEYLDRRPEQLLKSILSNQHKYVARREREGTLIKGLDYESLAKRIWEGTVVKELIGAQPMKANKGKVYSLQYTTKEPAATFPGLEGAEGRMLALEVLADEVEATTEKYKTCLVQNKHKDFNASKELENAFAAQIVQELDQGYIQKIIDIGVKHPDFDASKIFEKEDSSQPTFIADRFASIIVNINKMCIDIARRTRRGCGNWILCSPLIISILQCDRHSVYAPAIQGAFKGPNNSMLVGKLNGSIDVYSYLSTYDQAGGKIIAGYKGGSGECDAGLFYCPHTMITHTRKRKNREGEFILPFASTETCFATPNAGDYYASFDVTNLTFA
jgi:hypothetical protein